MKYGIIGLFLLATYSTALIAEETSGDASSDKLQQEIDSGEISPKKAEKIIKDENFDKADGGLYCPNNDCDADPDSVDSGI